MPKFLWLPYVAVIVATVVVFFAFSDNAAWFVSMLGTLAVLLGHGLYAVIDSRGRWPGLSAGQRLARILSFQR